MRLTEDVLLVGGGSMTGFGLSSGLDSHVYLLDGGEDYALVDCGMGTLQGLERILGHIEEAGIDPARITRLFLTHYHTDHAGGAAVFRERLGLSVSIAANARAALEMPDHTATQFLAARKAGFFPANYDYPACPVDDALLDEDRRTVGRLDVRFIATPGHCEGHGSFLVTGGERTYLFAGDALFARGRLYLQAIPDCDLSASCRSIRRIEALPFAALLPGHGSIVLDGAREHVDAAVSTIDRLGVPGGIF